MCMHKIQQKPETSVLQLAELFLSASLCKCPLKDARNAFRGFVSCGQYSACKTHLVCEHLAALQTKVLDQIGCELLIVPTGNTSAIKPVSHTLVSMGKSFLHPHRQDRRCQMPSTIERQAAQMSDTDAVTSFKFLCVVHDCCSESMLPVNTW